MSKIFYNEKGNQGALVKEYRKKPVVISACMFSGENGEAVAKWCDGVFIPQDSDGYECFVRITTLEGDMIATAGDYIIKGVKGEFYPCKPDIFDLTYEVEK